MVIETKVFMLKKSTVAALWKLHVDSFPWSVDASGRNCFYVLFRQVSRTKLTMTPFRDHFFTRSAFLTRINSTSRFCINIIFFLAIQMNWNQDQVDVFLRQTPQTR